jgi:membrane protease YdiL (CAAX protease family)
MKIGIPHAVLWTLGVFFTMNFAFLIVFGLRPDAEPDLVVGAAVQCAVFLAACSLFAARRPGRTWSDTFALRRTSVWVALLSLALGVAVCLPALSLAGWLEELRPMSETDKAAYKALFLPRSLAHGVALYVFVAGIGPFAEELLFRGALYSALRPLQTTASATWITAVLFTLTHLEPRLLPSILAVGVLLGVVRAVSGSLWPALFLHGAFNATTLTMPFLPATLREPSLALVLGCIPVAALVLVGIAAIGRASTAADRARQVDLEPDPGLGETHP